MFKHPLCNICGNDLSGPICFLLKVQMTWLCDCSLNESSWVKWSWQHNFYCYIVTNLLMTLVSFTHLKCFWILIIEMSDVLPLKMSLISWSVSFFLGIKMMHPDGVELWKKKLHCDNIIKLSSCLDYIFKDFQPLLFW